MTFEMRGLTGLDLQRFVFENHEQWACELCPCGSDSPGPVSDEEELVFLLINPTHFDEETGTLHPIAFQEVHNRDLSVIRDTFASEEEILHTKHTIIQQGMKRVPPKLRKIEQCARAKAGDVRAETDEQGRLFGIYDTPLPGQPSHASVFTRPDVLTDRRLKMIIRQRLHAVFSSQICALNE